MNDTAATSTTRGVQVNVATGVHRITQAATNCYLVEGRESLTLIDAAFPRSWSRLVAVLDQSGWSVEDIHDVVLTHGHFDHLGMASRLHAEVGATVWVHTADLPLARDPYEREYGRSQLQQALRQPRSIPHLASMARAGGLKVRGVEDVRTFEGEQALPVAGSPTVVRTPGHTEGHCAFLLADRSAVVTGDALVTLDPYTDRSGPRLVTRPGSRDLERARESLDAIAETGARIVLPGHGEPYRDGAAVAVQRAKEAAVE